MARMSSYRIDPADSNADGLILVTLTGRAQADTIVKLLNELNALAQSDIGRIARSWREAAALRTVRIAAFASNPVIYGLNRMFQGLAVGAEHVTVFNDRARARAWLLEG